jgi:hypothetical protein
MNKYYTTRICASSDLLPLAIFNLQVLIYKGVTYLILWYQVLGAAGFACMDLGGWPFAHCACAGTMMEWLGCGRQG